ncbi:hypothetical protein [Dactylosporangium cerinum]
MIPDSAIAVAGSRSTGSIGTGSVVCGAQAGTGTGSPDCAGADRRGLRQYRTAATTHRSIDTPSRRPSASTTATPAYGTTAANNTGRGSAAPTAR